MAYLYDSAVTYLNGAVTAGAMNMPVHAANDFLIMYVTMDSGAATITTGVGWAAIASEATNAAVTASWSYKLAASAAEAISITTADAYCCTIFCIRDCDTTTPIDISAISGINVATSTPVNASVTTTTTDCLVLYMISMDGIATNAHSNPGVHHIASFDNQGTTATTAATQHAAWYIQRAAGAVPAAGWTASASGVYTRFTIAIRNKAGGIIPAYIDDVSSPATVVTPGHHIGTLNNIAFPAALSNTTAVNTKTVTYVAAAAQADLGIVPFSNAISKAAATAAKTTLPGFEITLTGGRNWSTGVLMGSFIGATPKMGTFGMGSVSEGGCVIRIGSSATAWCAYQVAAKDSVPTLENRCVWTIQPGYTGSAYGTPGTAVTTTAVTYLQYLSNQPSFASNAVLAEVYQVFPQIIAGGTAAAPVDTDGMAAVGKSFRLPVIQKSGGYGLLSYAPIQIGGGDAVNFQIDAGSLQFPRRYNATTREIAYHGADNTLGISYAGKTGDVIKHTNSVVTSPTPYYWNINAAATSAATWDFTGLVIVNASVVLRNVMTFDSMSFSGCPTMDLTGCALTNCIISKPPVTNNSVTVSAATTLTSCIINTTTITAGNALLSTTTPVIFSGCSFTGSATGGHAFIITTAGTYTLTNCSFNGYGGTPGTNAVASSGSTSAAIYNNSGGLVTINVSGTGNSMSIRNGASSTTTVVAGSASVKVKAQTADGTAVELANVLLTADNGTTDYPAPDNTRRLITSITNAGTTATVTHTNPHGMSTGDQVLIKGASLFQNNGVFTITLDGVSPTTKYSYTMASAPGSNPTGTITATFVFIKDETDVNGDTVTFSKVFSGTVKAVGWARKSSADPYYKTSPISATLTITSGATNNLTALMIPD